MKAVLYAHDLQPITVIDLHPNAWRRLENGSVWNIAVMPPLKLALSVDFVAPINLHIVSITGDRIRKGEYETLMLFTHDEEASLLLRSALLPGQRKEHRDDYLNGVRDGFLRALQQGD